MVSAGSWLYGTACSGGPRGYGTVFKVSTNGTEFVVLRSFGGTDGARPVAGLVLSGSTLYGTSPNGGTNDFGTVYKINTDGSDFEVLKQFSEWEGRCPCGGLAIAGTTLYGTTRYSGRDGFGTLFKINIDGSGFAVLKQFDGNDGGNISASLLLDGSTIYGATCGGSLADVDGLLFKMNVDGNGYTILKRFTNRPGCVMAPGSLALVGTTLYGTTYFGGADNQGTVYQINTDGSGYAKLRVFSGGSDVANPSEWGGLGGAVPVVSDGKLYGTTSRGGFLDHGVVFSLALPTGAPAILHPPQSQTVGVGYPVVFTVEAAGSPALTYQWFFDITNAVTGETNAQLDLASARPADAGAYTVVVSNAFGVVTSTVATLTVSVLPHFSLLHTFNGNNGWNANGTLTVSGSTLYGTTAWGGIGYAPPGSFGYGEVFRIETNGDGFTVLKQFTRMADGGDPFAGLALSGTTLYGMTAGGGSNDFGTVFEISTDGSSFRVLKMFAGGNDGDYPVTRPVLDGTTLYGTTHASTYSGVVFKLLTDGSGYTVLKRFLTYNGDGAYPDGGLVLSGSTLYGTTIQGGTAGNVFSVNTDGTAYTVLKEFVGTDGQEPHADLLLSNGTLYGTTRYGGSSGYGTVFRMNTDGTGFRVLKHCTLRDGAYPYAGLLLIGQTLVGTARDGGYFGKGTVFELNTDGSRYSVLRDFAGSDGANPYAGLVLSGGTLYGTTANGGTFDRGTIFSLAFGTQTTNRPPAAGPAFIKVIGDEVSNIPAYRLLNWCSDPDNDPLNLNAVSSPSTMDAVVTLQDNRVSYSPPPGFLGDDTFGYTITDGNGGFASGTALLLVEPRMLAAATMLQPITSPGAIQVNFAGFADLGYEVERAESINGPWMAIGIVTTDARGAASFTDRNPPATNAFYRVVHY